MKIRGNTVGFPNPQPDWNQSDPMQADYIRNKPDVVGSAGELTKIDLSNFVKGSYTETVNGEVITHTVTSDATGRPIKIDDVDIVWGDA